MTKSNNHVLYIISGENIFTHETFSSAKKINADFQSYINKYAESKDLIANIYGDNAELYKILTVIIPGYIYNKYETKTELYARAKVVKISTNNAEYVNKIECEAHDLDDENNRLSKEIADLEDELEAQYKRIAEQASENRDLLQQLKTAKIEANMIESTSPRIKLTHMRSSSQPNFNNKIVEVNDRESVYDNLIGQIKKFNRSSLRKQRTGIYNC